MKGILRLLRSRIRCLAAQISRAQSPGDIETRGQGGNSISVGGT
jgi:hypothetical protein